MEDDGDLGLIGNFSLLNLMIKLYYLEFKIPQENIYFSSTRMDLALINTQRFIFH